MAGSVLLISILKRSLFSQPYIHSAQNKPDLSFVVAFIKMQVFFVNSNVSPF